MRVDAAAERTLRPEIPVRVDLFARVNPVWYEDLGHHRLEPTFIREVRCLLPDAAFRRSGVWVHVTPPDAAIEPQGWKLHLSARIQDAIHVLRTAAALCGQRRVRFKFVGDPELLRLVNSKMWPREASGKFVVLYPHSTEEFLEIGRALDASLLECRGPYVLSDRQFGQSPCVFYRYGGFQHLTRVRPDATQVPLIRNVAGEWVPDQRRPTFVLPEGRPDPVRSAAPTASSTNARSSDGKPEAVRIAKRFIVQNSLYASYAGFSAAGGVYRAFDTATGETVVLKEARPFVGSGDAPRGQAIATLEREFDLLARLADTGVTPKPVGLFWDSGERHRFLAEEFVHGMLLGPMLIGSSPIFDARPSEERRKAYRQLIRRIWVELAEALATVHDCGVCIGDLSMMNVMVNDWDEEPKIRIVDLEGGWVIGTPASQVYTPGFALAPETRGGRAAGSPEERARLAGRGPADDLFSLGRVFLGCLIPVTSLAMLCTEATDRLFRAAAAQIGVPEAALQMLLRLTAQEPGERPGAKQVAAYFRDPSSMEGAPSAMPPIPFEHAIEDLSTGIARHIEASADVSRTDRVFPADPRVFSTNGVNLAHGVSGVLHALHAARRPLRNEHRAWLLSQALDPDKLSPGVFGGVAGIACVLAELGEEDLAVSAMRQAARHRVTLEDPFLYGGAAGVGLASLWLHGRTADPGLLEDSVRLADTLLRSAQREKDSAAWVNATGDIPLGLLYGSSGISLFFLYAWLATGNDAYRIVGQEAMETTLRSHVIPDGRDFWTFPSYANRGAKRLRNYWADGSAGVAIVLARWIRAMGHQPYVTALDHMLPDTERRMTIFPSLLLGMSGMGMAHLDLWQLLGRTESLDHAQSLISKISLYTVKREDGIGIPGDQLQRFSCDLATGASGVLLFLTHMQAARKAMPAPSFGIAPIPDQLLPGGIPVRAIIASEPSRPVGADRLVSAVG